MGFVVIKAKEIDRRLIDARQGSSGTLCAEDSMTLAQVGIEDGSSLTLSVESSQGDCQSPCCCCEIGRGFCIPSGAYYSSGCCSPGSVSFKGASIAVSQAAEGAPVHTMER